MTECDAKLEMSQDREFWPTADYLALMNWPVHEVEILGFTRRVDQPEPEHYRAWDQAGMGRTLRAWAGSYGFHDSRVDRMTHANGTYIEVGYSMKTVTLRWGRDPAPGRDGGMEGKFDVIRGHLTLEEREMIDATLKELASRE